MAVQHMVWIKFNDTVKPDRQREHLAGLRSLKDRVPGIQALALGENFTNRARGFTHGLLVTLPDRQALQTYLDHPEHLAVAKPLKQDADLMVMDIEE